MSLERARAMVYGMALGHSFGARTDHDRLLSPDGVSSIQAPPDTTLFDGLTGDTQVWKTNALLVGYAYHDRIAALYSAAEMAWLFDDWEARPYAASLATALTIALTLNGIHDYEYARRIVEGCDGVSDTLDAAFYRLGHALAWSDEHGAMEHIGREGDDESMVALACYCMMRYPMSFVLAVRLAVSYYGERARLGYLVGGMMGVKLGLWGIPQSWLGACSKDSVLEDIAMIGETLRRNET